MFRLEAPPHRAASAEFSGRERPFTGSAEKGASFTLIPLELDIDEGIHTLHMEITFLDGTRFSKPFDLPIRKGVFASTQLRVDPRFTAPSSEEMVRIEKERELVARVYENPQPGWLGSGDFIRPLDGAVSSPFGVKRTFNDEVRSRHRGIDLRSPPGTPLRASNSGLVVFTGSLFYAGDTVIIDHGLDVFTIYCHLSEITVKEGDAVKKGTTVGKVGATGRVTGPHLHWGVRIAGTNVDPLSILHLTFD